MKVPNIFAEPCQQWFLSKIFAIIQLIMDYKEALIIYLTKLSISWHDK